MPLDEADTKTKSLMYLSFRAEARRTYHQKKPHTQIEKFFTHVNELNVTLKIPRNNTIDIIKLFKSMHQPNESLEKF